MRVRLQPLRYLLKSATSPMRLAMTRRSRRMQGPIAERFVAGKEKSTSAAKAALLARSFSVG